MSNNTNWTNLGEQIVDSVSDALSTGDFSQLNTLVSDTVNNALTEARLQAAAERQRQEELARKKQRDWQQSREEYSEKEKEWRRRQEELRIQERERREAWRREQQTRARKEAGRREELRTARAREQAAWQQSKASGNPVRSVRNLVKTKRVGSVSGILYIVFGSIGMGGAAIALFVLSILYLTGHGVTGGMILAGILILLFVLMLRAGICKRARLQRADRYIQVCGQKMYETIEKLARQTNSSIRFVRRDLKKMLRIGMFPEGHLDDRGTCFMLNDVVYHQYLQTDAAYRQRAALETTADTEEKSLTEQVAEARRQQENELNAMVSEGMEYIRRLRDLNDEIADESISKELFTLENLLNQIFDRVREHPEQMARMHKMMDYYLPTTVKLVEGYREFSKVTVPGEDILTAQAEIEKTLGIINKAFAELLNHLFQESAFDVTTDAQVLQTMLAQEGLTGGMDEFEKASKEKVPAG